MPKKEPYNGEINPEKLRELLWADDFTKMPVRDPSEYNEKEAKLYKTSGLIHFICLPKGLTAMSFFS